MVNLIVNQQNRNVMEDQEKEDIIRAKQAISPSGLGDQSVEGTSGPGSVIDPEPLPADRLEDEYMDGDEIGENVHELNHNRNTDKPKNTTGPAYS
jgi:hypothetical protein